jgi:anthranilate/para-aminobenzoate synthase component II
LKPDGLFLSNGPGDPAAVTVGVATVKELINTDLPLFGICLGHQILSLAYGASTFKLKFGHRGANHPIKRLSDGAVEIASHNHGFSVDPKTLPSGLRMSHINLNDQTCAGISHDHKPQFSVQYHPEAGPGPADPLYLFSQFRENIRKHIAYFGCWLLAVGCWLLAVGERPTKFGIRHLVGQRRRCLAVMFCVCPACSVLLQSWLELHVGVAHLGIRFATVERIPDDYDYPPGHLTCCGAT